MSRLQSIGKGPIVLLIIAAIGTAAIVTSDSWTWVFNDGDAQTTGVAAPTVDVEEIDEESERLYRIAANDGSSLTYTLEESLAGRSRTTSGITTVLAGDIVVSLADPAASQVGTIVVNVEMFESDSSLRDKRIRHDFLESTRLPFATFEPTSVEGLPATITDGVPSDLTITGDLTVKEATATVTFTGSAVLSEEALEASLTATVLMSTYGIGPIHVAGLAHTGDEIALTFELRARRVDLDSPTADRQEIQTDIALASYADGEFAETVQPILEVGCASCHVEGGSGFSTVELDTAGKAAELADDIALVTTSRYMPPWPASDLGLEFDHDFSLNDDQVATLAAWAADGGGLDVDPLTPLRATTVVFDDIERDQVVPAREAYTGNIEQQDDYRCLIHEFEDPEGDGEWISGIGFEPDQDEVVHHSIVYRVPAAGREEAENLAAADGRPGWACFGLSNMRTEGVRSIGGWAPGQQPRVYPDGYGLYLEPGDFIVNQIHYHFEDEVPADQSVLVFDTVSTADLAARTEPMTPVDARTFLTPAEGPCTPEEDGPLCDRAAVLADIGEKYGTFATFIPDALIGQCGGSVDDYDDLDGTRFSSSCDLRAGIDGKLYSVLGHMHEFGAAYRMTLNPDTPDERVLLDIPSWSFEWQLYYVPTDDLQIDAGDTIRLECTWDRANASLPEPRYITWNEGTVDEMCFSSITVLPEP